ncbi:MAG TPA: HEAT repeat domain-containing protein [Rhizomicrobium sp.]|nr:HEAT repeat domain-containing protein [Rhizomicrobium sp.]
MPPRYEPKSEFLKAVLAEKVPLSGGNAAEENLRRLIAVMHDNDQSNRDWATFLLALEDIDTPTVREVLLHATRDSNASVRAEAVWGLARRDPTLALPLVQDGLRADSVEIPMLEAAELCAHPSLVADLRIWAEPSDVPYADKVAADALAACEQAAAEDSGLV